MRTKSKDHEQYCKHYRRKSERDIRRDEQFDFLLEGLESGRLQGDEPVSTEMLEDMHEDPVEYLARKYGIGSDADGDN